MEPLAINGAEVYPYRQETPDLIMGKTILVVRVQPRSSRQELIRISATEYKARLNSAPEKGRANQELLELLSDHLQIPVSRMKITRGESSRVKWVEIS